MKNLIYTFLIMILAACSTAKVNQSEPVANIDWSEYKTFDIQIPEERFEGIPTEKILTLKSAVSNELKNRGFTENSENADMVVNLDMVLEDKVQTRQTNIQTDPINYIGQRRFHWRVEEKEVGHYKQGTITLNLVDADTKESIWKATIEDRVPPTEKRVERLVQESVNALFDNFPVTAQNI